MPKSHANPKHRRAQASGRELTDRIRNLGGRCMEQIIDDDFAIYCERWILPNGVGVIAYYSQDYREVFIAATPDENTWAATEAVLAKAAGSTAQTRFDPLEVPK